MNKNTTLAVSIIIVTYNPSIDLLTRCVESLIDFRALNLSEVIIVDNNSENIAAIEQLVAGHDAQLERCTENRGFAAANNRGLELASGRYLLLLNPDVIVKYDALERMVEYLEQHSEAGIVSPRTYDIKGDIALTAYGHFSPTTLLWQYLGLNRIVPNIMLGKHLQAVRTALEPFEVSWVQASCMLFRRELYEQIGGLDEKLFLFCEEPDYCERAVKQGWKVIFLPGAEVEHHESTTISRYPLIKMRHYHISPLYYFTKRNNRRAIMLLKLGFTLELVVKLILRFAQFTWLTNELAAARLRAYPLVIREIWQY